MSRKKRGQRSEGRGQRSEVRGRRSEVRSQRSEVRGQKLFKAVFCLLISVFCLLIFTRAYAVPPMPGKPGRQIGPKDGVGSIWQRRETGTKVKGALPFTTGKAKIIVLRVEFADEKLGTSREKTEELMEKLRDYYQEVSYRQLELEITVSSNVYRLSENMDYYGSNSNENSRLKDLLTDAVEAADTDIDFSAFDAVIVYHAGFGEESSGSDGDIWSAFLDGLNIAADNGMTTIGEGSIVPEKEAGPSPLGVIAHEFGHQLGLPDLYDTTGDGGSVIGDWGLMDAGAWLGDGLKPGHLCAWSKVWLGWIVPLEVTPCKVNQVDTANIYKIMANDRAGEKSDEYFLVSNRQKWGYDSYLPGDGLLIWHIDDSMGSIKWNTVNNYHPPRVYLENGRPFYQGGNDAFTPYTTPNSNANNGEVTGISIEEISSSGPIMTMYVGVSIPKPVSPPNGSATSSLRPTLDWEDIEGAAYTFQLDTGEGFSSPLINEEGLNESEYTPSSDLEKVVHYWRVKAEDMSDTTKESPFSQAWTILPGTSFIEAFAYPNPTHDGEITIRFKPSSQGMSLDEIKLAIYDISGELVIEADGGELETSLSPILYEYHFKGKNKAGKKVASGIYIYCIKCGQETQCNKMAVIRWAF